MGERVDPRGIGIPGEHEARPAADEGIETPAAVAERLQPVVTGGEEHGIGLRREHQLERRARRRRGRE